MELHDFLYDLKLENWEWIYDEHQAYEEDIFRIDTLRSRANDLFQVRGRRYTNADMHNLADMIENCIDGEACRSPACKRCTRQHQIEHVTSILEVMLTELNMGTSIRYCALHLVQYSRNIEAYEFLNYDVQADKDRLRKLLSSSGIDGPVLGSLEMDFHKSPQKWLSHYHLLTKLTGNEQALGRLSDKIKRLHPEHIKSGVTARPFMVQKIGNPVKQLSYLCKLGFNEVRDYKTNGFRRCTKKYRLDTLLFCDYLCWMNELGRRKFLFQYHAREWKKIKRSEF
ncbi:hypothetical protein [Vibrio alginolyticus]